MRFITIQKLDGTQVKTKDVGLNISKFRPSPPTLRNVFDSLNGRHGQIDFGASYEPREIEVEGFFNGITHEYYPLYRDQLFRMFGSLEAFYIIDSAQPWKRWLVRINGDWDVDKVNLSTYGEFKLTFITVESPFAETNATTLEPKVWKDEGWWWGSNVFWGDDDEYIYKTSQFIVRNFGDVPIDPRQTQLVLTYKGPSNNLVITNTTTGEQFKYFGTTTIDDDLKIDGIRTLKNGLSVIADTNLKLLTLKPGENIFTVAGNTGKFTLSIEFRYLYL